MKADQGTRNVAMIADPARQDESMRIAPAGGLQ
jgi:hypothetical protein